MDPGLTLSRSNPTRKRSRADAEIRDHLRVVDRSDTEAEERLRASLRRAAATGILAEQLVALPHQLDALRSSLSALATTIRASLLPLQVRDETLIEPSVP